VALDSYQMGVTSTGDELIICFECKKKFTFSETEQGTYSNLNISNGDGTFRDEIVYTCPTCRPVTKCEHFRKAVSCGCSIL